MRLWALVPAGFRFWSESHGDGRGCHPPLAFESSVRWTQKRQGCDGSVEIVGRLY
jgi:hypothetical protein